ncbi:hypothetical protein [Rhodococcus tibetensis]|uniref:Uncharacterized protein n=1 Tax=Rhodococcus tibetensis TaxID=2965064 RepID=A0ABT1Q6T5_9NOCA|nr:hypothetical protein [Rhodococcus sp. FXJ9.536]MCQ4117964.1 hypothetical protein [Rhodococcus sp. FXJ9.536]
MEGADKFAREVIAALRPVLPAETIDHVSFSLETGQVHKALIEAIGGAVKQEVAVPARVVETVRELLAGGSLRRRDARALNRMLPRLRVDTAT